jgi:NAD(P)-dependent dehydrogenase (short-subunit alcohol dehydrogenase family)
LLAAQGANVVVNDIDDAGAKALVAEIEAAGGTAIANKENVATWAGGGAIVQHAIDTYGQLDILVNNAGVLRDAMSFNLGEEDFDAVIAVHVKGHAATCRAAAAHWRTRAKAGEDVAGRIINTASEAGLDGQAGQLAYSTAKSGILGMTLVLARELRKYNVTANAVCPRALTAMTETMPGAADFMGGPDYSPDNIAPLVCFLGSDAAADVNGQVFIMVGARIYLMQGWTMVHKFDRGAEDGELRRWTPEELVARKDELFAGRRSKVPHQGFGE